MRAADTARTWHWLPLEGSPRPLIPIGQRFRQKGVQAGRQEDHYGAADGMSTAGSCADAQRAARDMHQKYLAAYGLTAAQFPLMTLRPDNWEQPFA